MRIGTFMEESGRYIGRLQTATLDLALALLPAEAGGAKNAPDYRVMAGSHDTARDVGAGWKHASEKAGDYVAIQIDDPTFARPLRAKLFHGDEGEHVLVWSRRAGRKPEA